MDFECTDINFNLLLLESSPFVFVVSLDEPDGMAIELLFHSSNDNRFLRTSCFCRCVSSGVSLNQLSKELIAGKLIVHFSSAAYNIHVAGVNFFVTAHTTHLFRAEIMRQDRVL